MNKNIVFIFCLLLEVVVGSCNDKQTVSNKDKLDTVWNEKVQDTFYGLKLGTSVSVDQIAEALGQHGFYLVQGCGSESLLHFSHNTSRNFSFGGLEWEMLDVERTNNVLTGICFMNSSLDKASSLSDYDNVKNAVEAKYSPTFVTASDTTVYARTRYFGKNNVQATISCFRYETVTKKIMIGMALVYTSSKDAKSANDEL